MLKCMHDKKMMAFVCLWFRIDDRIHNYPLPQKRVNDFLELSPESETYFMINFHMKKGLKTNLLGKLTMDLYFIAHLSLRWVPSKVLSMEPKFIKIWKHSEK